MRRSAGELMLRLNRLRLSVSSSFFLFVYPLDPRLNVIGQFGDGGNGDFSGGSAAGRHLNLIAGLRTVERFGHAGFAGDDIQLFVLVPFAEDVVGLARAV